MTQGQVVYAQSLDQYFNLVFEKGLIRTMFTKLLWWQDEATMSAGHILHKIDLLSNVVIGGPVYIS